ASAIRGFSGEHGPLPAAEPIAKAWVGTNLIAVGFPRRRAQIPAKSESQSERRFDEPFVLRVELVFIDSEGALYGHAFCGCGAGFVKVVERADQADGSQQLREAIVKCVGTAAIQRNGETARLDA